MTEVWLMVNRKTGVIAFDVASSTAKDARKLFAERWDITPQQAAGAAWRAVKFVPASEAPSGARA